jgi:hypothetical protein
LSPKEEVVASPVEEVSVVPEEAPLSPKEEVVASPVEEVTATSELAPLSPKEEVVASPVEAVSAVPEEAPLSPKEELAASPVEEETEQPVEVPLSPKEDVTTSQVEEDSAVPKEAPLLPTEEVSAVPLEAPVSPKEYVDTSPVEVSAVPEEAPLSPKEISASLVEEISSIADAPLSPKEEVFVFASPVENVETVSEAFISTKNEVAASPVEEAAFAPQEAAKEEVPVSSTKHVSSPIEEIITAAPVESVLAAPVELSDQIAEASNSDKENIDVSFEAPLEELPPGGEISFFVTMTKEDTHTVSEDDDPERFKSIEDELAALPSAPPPLVVDVPKPPTSLPPMSPASSTRSGFEEVEETLPDGTIVRRRLIRAKVRRMVTKKIRRVGPDGKVIEDVVTEEYPESDITSETSRSSISDAHELVSPVSSTASVPRSPGELASPADSLTSFGSRHSMKVYADTVEGEPVIETEIREVEETLPDGRIVKKKIIKTRQKQTIVKRVVMEGPQSEEEAGVLLGGHEAQRLRELEAQKPSSCASSIVDEPTHSIRSTTSSEPSSVEGKIKFKVSMEPRSVPSFEDNAVEVVEDVYLDEDHEDHEKEAPMEPELQSPERSRNAPRASDASSSPGMTMSPGEEKEAAIEDLYEKERVTLGPTTEEIVTVARAEVERPEKGMDESAELDRDLKEKDFVDVVPIVGVDIVDNDNVDGCLRASDSRESVEEKSEKESLDDFCSDVSSVIYAPYRDSSSKPTASGELGRVEETCSETVPVVAAGDSGQQERAQPPVTVISHVDISDKQPQQAAAAAPAPPILIMQEDEEQEEQGEVVQEDGLPGSGQSALCPQIVFQEASPMVQSPTSEGEEHDFSDQQADMEQVRGRLEYDSDREARTEYGGPQEAPVDFPAEHPDLTGTLSTDVQIDKHDLYDDQDEEEDEDDSEARPLSPTDFTLQDSETSAGRIEADIAHQIFLEQSAAATSVTTSERPPSPSDYTLVAEEQTTPSSHHIPDDVYGVPEPVQPVSPLTDELDDVRPGKHDPSAAADPFYFPQHGDGVRPSSDQDDSEEEEDGDGGGGDDLMPGTNTY